MSELGRGVEHTLSDFDDDFEPVALDTSDMPAGRYIDRELSWLAFNQRVLELAEDERTPLLERANFAAIFASNLDEFFMVRVAGLKRRIDTGIAVPSMTGLAPTEQLAEILSRASALQSRHADAYRLHIRPALDAVGITVLDWSDLSEAERTTLDQVFAERIFPVLTPLAVDPAHPFPYISGLSLNLAVRIRHPKNGRIEFARVKVPQTLPRFVRVGFAQRYLPLELLIANHLADLFPGMEVIGHDVFRVTRNEDLEVDEDDTEDLLQALEQELLRRRFGPPIRLEVADSMAPETREFLVRELDISDAQVFALPMPLDLTGLFELMRIDRSDLRFTAQLPTTNRYLQSSEPNEKADLFAAITKRDVLVHHPYESFATSVQAFLEQAAADPHVLAIKQTLYRTSGDSPIVEALIAAAEAGKQVLALVEIKARFDEQANITWARKLEKAGVHVVYGLVGLKTHCKLALVVREEQGRLVYYSHIGTGNYNPKTSRIYEDFGLFTRDQEVGKELTRLFNELSGYAIEKKFQRLLVAPRYLRKGLIKRITTEAQYARAGKPSGIRLKLNSLVDENIIDALYDASKAGVPIELWIRGICALRPGVPGLSETIRVRSVVGRYLEHSRVFWFASGGDPVIYIGSADMMHRNLDRRVEVLVQLVASDHLQAMTDLFDLAFSEESRAWELGSDSVWTLRHQDESGVALRDVQTEIAHRTQIASRLVSRS